MKVAGIQFSPRFGNIPENLAAIDRLSAGLQADLVVLPELCTTGYQFRDRQELATLAEPADGTSVGALIGMAASWGGHVVAGLAESEESRIYNSALLVNADGVVGKYRKVHLFADEKRLFDPGDLGFGVWKVGEVLVGLMVCFDWIFPESARSLALGGARIIAHPANLVLPHCQDAMITRALENRVFTITVNRTGSEERIPGTALHFTGSSQLIAPDGTIVARASADAEEIVVARIDPSLAGDKHVTATNHVLDDRRPDQYRS